MVYFHHKKDFTYDINKGINSSPKVNYNVIPKSSNKNTTKVFKKTISNAATNITQKTISQQQAEIGYSLKNTINKDTISKQTMTTIDSNHYFNV